jgi:copper chaperone CopZ
MIPLHLKIDGMSCGHCVARVEKALQRLDGVVVGRVFVGDAELSYDPARIGTARVREALADAGYTAQVVNALEAVA